MLNSLFALAIMGGCQAANEPAQPQTNTTIESPAPQDPTAQNQNGGKQNTGTTVTQKDERRYVSNRRFQLKDLKKAKVSFGKNEFELWVMDTYDKRMEGMMFLENSDFKDNEGMIFVFKDPDIQRFWMKNTLVPLDVAYVVKQKYVATTYTMKALDTETDYSSTQPCMYVIELRAGMLKKKGIQVGDKVDIPASVFSKD